jgi:penicillin amidase
MLDAGGPATPPSIQAMQQDSISLAARELLPLLLEARPETDRGQVALSLLSAWDGRMERDQAAPLIFYAWLRELTRVIFADELGDDFEAFQRPRPALVAKVLREERAWCDDRTTEETEGCPAQLVTALEDALNLLTLRFRQPVDRLRWGEAHLARFGHPVLSRLPLFDAIFGFALETSGGGFTVNRAAASFNGPSDSLFEDIHGPGYRAVYDLGDLDDSRFIIATGQSGNPLSPHYGSLAKRWRDGIYVKLDGGGQAPHTRLRLMPK